MLQTFANDLLPLSKKQPVYGKELPSLLYNKSYSGILRKIPQDLQIHAKIIGLCI